jgi:hypothetical protein
MLSRLPSVRRLAPAALVLALLAHGGRARAEDKTSAPVDKGLRVATCAHSFHGFVVGNLANMAKLAGIKGHTIAATSFLGGSRVIQHWNAPEEKSKVKAALRAGKVDVLTLSPIYPPDEGIEKFARLALEHNPNVRVAVQELWLPYDVYDTKTPLKRRKVDHDAATAAELHKQYEAYFKDMDAYVREVNKKVGKDVLVVVPAGQAVLALREKIIAGKAPGLKKQSDLFTDDIGHATAPLQAVVAYCNFAVVYRRSPVGLPMPSVLARMKGPEGEKLNRLLQELAWEAVVRHPLSGVKAEGR